jgi:hypothetical protein
VRDIAVAALSATLLGAGMGGLFRLPAPPEQAPDWSYATAGDEDPNVTLHRAVMGSDPPTAPQPYVPIPRWNYSDWIEPEQDEQQVAAESALTDVGLLGRREMYPTSYGSSEPRLAAAGAVDAAQETTPSVAGVDSVAEPALSWGGARDLAHQGAEG